MEKQELTKFIKWLSSNVDEFKNKTPEEIVTTINKLSQTEEGMNAISDFINKFKKNSQMFREGGKLNYFIKKYRGGGKNDNKKQKINSQVYTDPESWPTKKDSNGIIYYIMPADTVGSIVYRAVAKETSPQSEEPGLVITEQAQTVGDPGDTYTHSDTRVFGNIRDTLKDEFPLIDWTIPPKLPRNWLERKLHKSSDVDKKFFELYNIK